MPCSIRRFRLMLALTCLPFVPFAGGADWPQFLGPERNGTYRGNDLAAEWPKAGPATVWRMPLGTGWSGPVVSAGRLIIFHREGDEEILDCLEAATGKRVWRATHPTAYVDGFGFDNGPRATPAIADGRIFAMGAEGTVWCVEFTSGKKLWHVNVREKFGAPKGFFGHACSPLVHGGRVWLNIGGAAGAGIIALDTATGKLALKATDDEASYSSPIAIGTGDAAQLIFFTRHNLFSLRPATAAVNWQLRWSPAMQASVSAATPLAAGSVLFATASYGAGAVALEFSATGTRKLWDGDDILSAQYGTPAHREGHLYGFDGRVDTGARPELRCVELRTGKIKWSSDRVDAGAIILAGGELLVVTQNGQLVRVAARTDGFHERTRAQLLGLEVRAHPALADGRLFARDKQRLIAVDLRAR